MRMFFLLLTALSTLALPRVAEAEALRLGAPTLAPMSHVFFCLRYPEECKQDGGQNVALTAERMRELAWVNANVNSGIRPERNTEGLAGEKWLIWPASGDCNDYAVTKRHELLKRGWSQRQLLLAHVITPWGEGHLVLIARTENGDFVLDNLETRVLPWTEMRHRFVRIQSPDNPRFWAEVANAPVYAQAVPRPPSRAYSNGRKRYLWDYY